MSDGGIYWKIWWFQLLGTCTVPVMGRELLCFSRYLLLVVLLFFNWTGYSIVIFQQNRVGLLSKFFYLQRMMTIRLIMYVMPFALALARRYSTPPKDTYVVARRCPPDKPSAWTETYFESKDTALVSCCKNGEEKGFRKVNRECAKEVNHTDAIAFCARGGMLTFPFIDETTISLYIHYLWMSSRQVDGYAALTNSPKLVTGAAT